MAEFGVSYLLGEIGNLNLREASTYDLYQLGVHIGYADRLGYRREAVLGALLLSMKGLTEFRH